ncbi:amino acid ABC transporter permease [Coriobacteriales bacterium OH1046]|nr:amino acid ABC transporter permease [Coriobacteriales bacterium OH1046]
MSASPLSMRDALYEAPGPKMRKRIVAGTCAALMLIAIGLALVVRQFYVTGQLEPRYWALFARGTTWSFLAQGFLGTLRVAVTAGALALVLGLVLMLGRISEIGWLSMASRLIIDFFRGVPSLLLIYFFFLVIPKYGIRMPSFWMITLPVALAASGVLAEVFRAGVNAVPAGQTEAALSLGMGDAKIMAKIILPQALRIVIPSLVSQLVVVVKDTTVAYVVSYPDLMQNARVLISNYDALVSMYFVVAIIYIIVNFAINQLSIHLAHRENAPIITKNTTNPV